MKLLVFGSSGQVATELQVIAPDAVFLSRQMADLSDPAACAAAVRDHRPDMVINAAAYTAVDRAEEEEELASVINGVAPGAIATEAAALGIPMVHISTDYVFDGTGQEPWSPSDLPAPQNAYGRTKLAGEMAVRNAGGTHAILRTSWVFSAHGNNFLKTMLRLSETRTALSIVDDQIGGPTPAKAIADACKRIGRHLQDAPQDSGTYHFSGAPDTSWKGFAEQIFRTAGREVEVTGIPTQDYPTPARRPLNSRLDCTDTERVFGIARPDWRTGIRDVVAALKGAS